jgi:hypothetical protein
VTLFLIGKSVAERGTHRSGLISDEEVNVRNFIAITGEGFSNVERHAVILHQFQMNSTALALNVRKRVRSQDRFAR